MVFELVVEVSAVSASGWSSAERPAFLLHAWLNALLILSLVSLIMFVLDSHEKVRSVL